MWGSGFLLLFLYSAPIHTAVRGKPFDFPFQGRWIQEQLAQQWVVQDTQALCAEGAFLAALSISLFLLSASYPSLFTASRFCVQVCNLLDERQVGWGSSCACKRCRISRGGHKPHCSCPVSLPHSNQLAAHHQNLHRIWDRCGRKRVFGGSFLTVRKSPHFSEIFSFWVL